LRARVTRLGRNFDELHWESEPDKPGAFIHRPAFSWKGLARFQNCGWKRDLAIFHKKERFSSRHATLSPLLPQSPQFLQRA
jgi:hypothetical protein